MEVTIPNYNELGDDYFVELSAADFRARIERSGMCDHLRRVIADVVDNLGGKPDRVEIMDYGLRTPAFHDCAVEFLKERGVQISRLFFVFPPSPTVRSPLAPWSRRAFSAGIPSTPSSPPILAGNSER